VSDGPVAAVSSKLPVPMRDKLFALARRRNVTPSALIRSLIVSYLAGDFNDDEIGDVERAVRAEFEESGVEQGPKHATAINLSRRLDRDPTNGPGHARELGWLLNDLRPEPDEPFGLDEIRAKIVLHRLGYTVTSPAWDGGPVATYGTHPNYAVERERQLREHGGTS
jgi:hypothetical protein